MPSLAAKLHCDE